MHNSELLCLDKLSPNIQICKSTDRSSTREEYRQPGSEREVVAEMSRRVSDRYRVGRFSARRQAQSRHQPLDLTTAPTCHSRRHGGWRYGYCLHTPFTFRLIPSSHLCSSSTRHHSTLGRASWNAYLKLQRWKAWVLPIAIMRWFSWSE
jgi:hypothetical protein